MKSLFDRGIKALNTSAENEFLQSEYHKAENISIFHTPKNSFTTSGEIYSLLEGKAE